jgi:RNA polymerase sigma-70 factor (ECF subfamily)
MGCPRWSAFFLGGPDASRDGSLDPDDLDRELERRISAGRSAWPALRLPPEEFVRHVARHWAGGKLPTPDRSADLWLAVACARGVPEAASTFERHYRSVIERAAARVDVRCVEEVTQSVLVALLVQDKARPPYIASYAGRAALATWLATVASRAAGKPGRRRADRPHDSTETLAALAAFPEPELALARARYGRAMESALRAAVADLADRERVLLRLHHGEGWSVDRLAELYGVGRSTASRWVVAAREALLVETKRRLNAELGVTGSELDSLVAILRSEVDVSLVRLLGAHTNEADAHERATSLPLAGEDG